MIRITGNEPTKIYGTLDASEVFVISPHGVWVGPEAKIEGYLTALSTREVDPGQILREGHSHNLQEKLREFRTLGTYLELDDYENRGGSLLVKSQQSHPKTEEKLEMQRFFRARLATATSQKMVLTVAETRLRWYRDSSSTVGRTSSQPEVTNDAPQELLELLYFSISEPYQDFWVPNQ